MAQKSFFGNMESSKEILLKQHEADLLVAMQALGDLISVSKFLERKETAIRYTLNRLSAKLHVAKWQNLRFCKSQRKSKSGAIRKAQDTTATVDEIVRIIEKQEFRCALSGVTLKPDEASLDHITPRAVGGTNEASNLQWLHKDVNQAKGKMSNEEFIAMCRRVAAWTS